MILEKILFNVLAIALFTIIFLKLIKKNDTSYIIILILEVTGIFINFLELLMNIKMGWFSKTLMYLLSVIIPFIILWIEYFKNINFPELVLLISTRILTKAGKNDKAKEKMKKYLEKNANSYTINKLLAQVYEKEENYAAAVSCYRKVVDLNRNDIESTFQLASNLVKEKQTQEATELLQEVLRRKPENENATQLLGDILMEQERYKEAVSIYLTALRYHPESYELYYDLGIACTLLNDFQRAKEFYEKAANINSLLYNANLNLGQIALIYGDLDEAEKFFLKACKGEEAESGSYYYLAKIAMLKGNEEKAKNYMNLAVQLDAKVYKQLQKDPIFLPIRKEINPPAKEMEQEDKKKLSKKEKIVSSHLANTCLLVEKLSNEDLESFRNRKQKQKGKKVKEKEKGQE